MRDRVSKLLILAACVFAFASGAQAARLWKMRESLAEAQVSAGGSIAHLHDEMLAVVPPEDAYELHVNLIRHGRALCRPRPRCGECELRRMCPWYREHA